MLCLIAVLWTLHLLGRAWRAWIQDQLGGEMAGIARELGGVLEPRWLGWRMQATRVEVSWQGGLSGEQTLLRLGPDRSRVHRLPGLLGAAELRRWLDEAAEGAMGG